MAIGTDTLGGALGIQGMPKDYADIAQENLRYNRLENERKRREAAKKQQEIDDKYGKLKFNVEGYLPALNPRLLRGAQELTGMALELKKQRYEDPQLNPEWSRKFQEYAIQQDKDKQTTTNFQADVAASIANPEKYRINPEFIKAAEDDANPEKWNKLTGGGYYTRGMALEEIKKEFNPVEFEKQYTSPLKGERSKGYKLLPNGAVVDTETINYPNEKSIYMDVFSAGEQGAQYQEFLTKEFNSRPKKEQEDIIRRAQSEQLPIQSIIAKERLSKYLEKGTTTSYKNPPVSAGGEEKTYVPLPDTDETVYTVEQQRQLNQAEASRNRKIDELVKASGATGERALRKRSEIIDKIESGDPEYADLLPANDQLLIKLAESKKAKPIAGVGLKQTKEIKLKDASGNEKDVVALTIKNLDNGERIIEVDEKIKSRIRNRILSDGTTVQEEEPEYVRKTYPYEGNEKIRTEIKGLNTWIEQHPVSKKQESVTERRQVRDAKGNIVWAVKNKNGKWEYEK